jgi:hypothetical protein
MAPQPNGGVMGVTHAGFISGHVEQNPGVLGQLASRSPGAIIGRPSRICDRAGAAAQVARHVIE